MKLLLVKRTALFFTILIAAAACKQPETVIVDENPTTAVTKDTTDQKVSERDSRFQALVIGEHNAIGSLDPLFADNASEMRAVQLVYEGLVRLNENGEIVPGMAVRWSASDDSLSYKFHLRPSVFYQDSDVFSTGTGRRLKSDDIKYVFERMAKAEVPPRAARLFMNIEGFDSYFQEQRFVYNPKYREIEGISGIQTPDETTVVFQLVKPDPDFLKKLATPLAAIYPEEAVGDADSSFSAVGTGPFTLSEQTADSTFIFTKFEDYYADEEISLNRVDMKVAASGTPLFKLMGAGEVHLLPQLGPQIMNSVLDSTGQLLSSYAGQYKLRKPSGFTEFILHYNPHSNLPASTAKKIAGLIESDSNLYFGKIPANLIRVQSFLNQANSGVPADTIEQQVFSTYSGDPFIQNFLGTLSNSLKRQNISLQMINIRAPYRNTGLLFTRNFPLIPDSQWSDFEKLFSFKVRHLALHRSAVNDFSYNQYPWWISTRGVTVATDNLN